MIDLKAKPFYLDDEAIEWVNKTLSEMSIEERTGQLFCILYKEGKQEEIDYVYSVLKPGGCMYRTLPLDRAVEFTQKLRKKAEVPLLIAANLEKGGSGIVSEGTTIGSHMEVAATDDVFMAEKMGIVCADEAKAVGANWAFAPIIDIDTNFRNPITNTRTFGSNSKRVMEMGIAYTKAVQERGVAASIKHFPGDGQDERDQHLVTSINSCSIEEWDETYGKVYSACIEEGALSCMIGHIMQPAYTRFFNPAIKDEDILPGSLSKELIEDLLRGRLGFNGLIVTDATTMAGYTLPMPRREAVPKSIAAGADMFLFARNLEEDYHLMLEGVKSGVITSERLEEAVTRILAMKAALKLHKELQPISIENAKEIVGCKKHQEWSVECADKAITLVKEQEGVLPVTTDKYKKLLFYPIESAGGASQYAVKEGVCRYVMDKLIAEGFEVDEFMPPQGSEGKTPPTTAIIGKYDLIIYVANLATKSNQTAVRIEWAQPMGANCAHYLTKIPTIFISVENPYHLLDVPRIKTFINSYNSNDNVLDQLIEKLVGRSAFKGVSPVDAFCGKWDTRL